MTIKEIFPGSIRLVKGKVPSSSLLLIGPSGVGKTIFCKQFIYNGLMDGEPSVVVTGSESPEELENSILNFGFYQKLVWFYASILIIESTKLQGE